MQYYADGVKDGGFESGIRAGVTGMLASPFFLYRGERVPAGLKPGEKYQITDLELASKLSFFLWNSIPDDELLDLAGKNKLSDPATLNQQVRRMLADPRSKTLASNFVFQWLEMNKLDEIVPDRDVFPYASGRHGPASGLPHRAHAVFRQHLPRRPQRRGFAAREPYLPE